VRGRPVPSQHLGADLDVGVRPVLGRRLSAQDRVRLMIELEDLLDVKRVDLVILPEADPFLAASETSPSTICTMQRPQLPSPPQRLARSTPRWGAHSSSDCPEGHSPRRPTGSKPMPIVILSSIPELPTVGPLYQSPRQRPNGHLS
jgi:hypothetical protein